MCNVILQIKSYITLKCNYNYILKRNVYVINEQKLMAVLFLNLVFVFGIPLTN